jgi:hypothetical protein
MPGDQPADQAAEVSTSGAATGVRSEAATFGGAVDGRAAIPPAAPAAPNTANREGVLVVYVNMKPAALRERAIDRQLAANGITLEAADAGQAAPAQQMGRESGLSWYGQDAYYHDLHLGMKANAPDASPADAILVEAPAAQVNGLLAALDADSDNVVGASNGRSSSAWCCPRICANSKSNKRPRVPINSRITSTRPAAAPNRSRAPQGAAVAVDVRQEAAAALEAAVVAAGRPRQRPARHPQPNRRRRQRRCRLGRQPTAPRPKASPPAAARLQRKRRPPQMISLASRNLRDRCRRDCRARPVVSQEAPARRAAA